MQKTDVLVEMPPQDEDAETMIDYQTSIRLAICQRYCRFEFRIQKTADKHNDSRTESRAELSNRNRICGTLTTDSMFLFWSDPLTTRYIARLSSRLSPHQVNRAFAQYSVRFRSFFWIWKWDSFIQIDISNVYRGILVQDTFWLYYFDTFSD